MAHTRAADKINKSTQEMQNLGFDVDYNVPVVETLGYSGSGVDRQLSDSLQIKAVESGGYQYFCFSSPGVAEATAGWMIFRLDATGNKMYADANANFDNVATDPTALSYSYS